jgi:hypothetical protein
MSRPARVKPGGTAEGELRVTEMGKPSLARGIAVARAVARRAELIDRSP